MHWVMQTSLLKTLPCKYRSTVSKMTARYNTTIDTPHGHASACKRLSNAPAGNR